MPLSALILDASTLLDAHRPDDLDRARDDAPTSRPGASLHHGALALRDAAVARGLRVAVLADPARAATGGALASLGTVLAPAPEPGAPPERRYVLAADALGLFGAECAVVSASAEAIAAGKNAGVVGVGLVHTEDGGGESDRAAAERRLRGAGARVVAESLGALAHDLDAALDRLAPGDAPVTRELAERLMREALAVAAEGMAAGEAPIGCVLARGDGVVIARGYNEMNRTQNKTAHAEIVTFARAAGRVPLDARDLIMASTLEPCVMCTGAAMEAAVDTILYALRAPADSGTGRVRAPESPESQMPRIVGDVLAAESRALFEEWMRRHGDEPQAAYVRQLLALTEGQRASR